MSDLAHPADLLARAIDLPAVDRPAYDLPPATRCALSGAEIAVGYRVPDLLSITTTDLLDTFRGGAYVSEAVARCFRSQNPRKGNPTARSHLVFADGTYFAPLIARGPARDQDRACWSDLVRQVWPARSGQTCLCLLTTDTKKRLWHRARVGPLGARTPVFVHDAGGYASRGAFCSRRRSTARRLIRSWISATWVPSSSAQDRSASWSPIGRGGRPSTAKLSSHTSSPLRVRP